MEKGKMNEIEKIIQSLGPSWEKENEIVETLIVRSNLRRKLRALVRKAYVYGIANERYHAHNEPNFKNKFGCKP